MLPELSSVLNLLEGGFGHLKILVVGDLMLDRYIFGDVDRISPEAPVPVLRHARRYERAGGAANVAMNLAGLGCKAYLAGFWGEDAEKGELAAILETAGVDTLGVVSGTLPTVSKTRIVGRVQQLLRLDIESREDRPAIENERLVERATELTAKMSAVILSDYAKGALTRDACEAIIRAARMAGRVPDVSSIRRRRTSASTQVRPPSAPIVRRARRRHRRCCEQKTEELLACSQATQLAQHGFKFLTVTMSEKGITRSRSRAAAITHRRSAREVFDVSGAGDTVIATLAASVAAGLPIRTAVDLANLAAGIVVAKVGTVPIAQHELIAALTPSSGSRGSVNKILDLDRVKLRSSGVARCGRNHRLHQRLFRSAACRPHHACSRIAGGSDRS